MRFRNCKVCGNIEKLTQVCGGCYGHRIDHKDCDLCDGTGEVEIMGDGDNFEYDVVDRKPCPKCNLIKK